MTNCPSCGSKNVEKTNKGNAQECVCNECLSQFNPALNEQYNEFSYDHFLDSVANKIQEGMEDARLGSAIRNILENHKNNGPQDVGMIVDRLVPMAEDLYNDYKMGRREKYDFGALMEGVNRLNEFALLQDPMNGKVNDDETPNEVPEVQNDVNELPDPLAMINPETDPAAEVGEHSSLEKLKNAISSVQNAIQSLEDSEKKEREAAGVEAEPVMPAYDPQQNPDLVHEGMQDAAINMPPLPGVDDETPEANPMNANLANSNSETKVGEGPEHEAEEDVAISALKASLAELQAAYAEYIGSEVKVHGDGEEGSVIGTTPETGIGGPLKSDLGDRVNALSKVNGVENKIYLEKAKELMEGFRAELKEDAELTSDDNMIKSYDNSIAISTAEIGKDPLIGNDNAPVSEGVDDKRIEINTDVDPEYGTAYWWKITRADGSTVDSSQVKGVGIPMVQGGDFKTNDAAYDDAREALHHFDMEDGHSSPEEVNEEGEMSIKDLSEAPGPENGEIADQPGEIMSDPVSPEDQASGFDQIDANKELIMITPDGTRHAGQKYNSDVIDAMKAIGCTFTPVGGSVDAPVDESKYSKELGAQDSNDISTFGINHTFNQDDNVLYEGAYHTITKVDGQYITLVDSNNEFIEVLAEDCEYANTEEKDVLGERFEQGNVALLNEWQKIEQKMNKDENLMGIKRQYDLRQNKNVKFLVEDVQIPSLPVMNKGIDDEDVQEAQGNPGFMLSNPEHTPSHGIEPIDVPEPKAPAKISSIDYKGKKGLKLDASNGKSAVIFPTMTDFGPRFYLYIDNKKVKSYYGKETFDFHGITDRLSELSRQGVDMADITNLTKKISRLSDHMNTPAAESNVPYVGMFTNPELTQKPPLEEAGYQYFEDAQSVAYINEGVEVALKEDIEEESAPEETNSNIQLPESKE